LWGIGVISDQQLAGAVMKVAGGMYLWGIVVYVFFTKFAVGNEDSYDYKRKGKIPPAEITGHDEFPLTTEDVAREFAQSAPPDA
jgi:putative membrane protein